MTAAAGLNSRDYLNASLAGLASALLFLASASSLVFWLLLYTAASMPLYGTALYMGWVMTLMAGGVGTLVVSAFQPPIGSLGIYFGTVALAPIVLAWLLFGERKASAPISGSGLGRAAATLSVIGAALGMAAVLWIENRAGQAGATSDAIRDVWAQAVSALQFPGQSAETVAERRAQMVEQFQQLGDGVIEMAMVELWIVIHVLAAAVALGLARRGRLVVGQTRLSSLQTPRWVLVALALAGVAVLVAGDSKVAPLVALAALAMPFMMEGLAVTHVVSRRWPARQFALTAIYFATVFMPLARFVMTLIGMADHWLEWRKKASSNSDKGA
jgi:Predicted membrane protein (DUF2232)